MKYFNNINKKKEINKLKQLMLPYQVDNLKNISSVAFKKEIDSLLKTNDFKSELYISEKKQRDLSIKFFWGHNHDFGNFELKGRMANRHIDLFYYFKEFFNIDYEYYNNKKVIDIGCWTGGVEFVLNSLSANITAIEEVNKYANATRWLMNAFDIKNVEVVNKSLFDLNDEDYYDKYNVVFYAGVIYHVTDPLLSLRILYNTLEIGGIILVESAGLESSDNICRYEGGSFFHHGDKEKKNRGGWNWFIPSASTLKLMMENAGFDNVKSIYNNGRLYAVGEKKEQKDITRAGLSVRNIK